VWEELELSGFIAYETSKLSVLVEELLLPASCGIGRVHFRETVEQLLFALSKTIDAGKLAESYFFASNDVTRLTSASTIFVRVLTPFDAVLDFDSATFVPFSKAFTNSSKVVLRLTN
jgi:hypothetical protein